MCYDVSFTVEIKQLADYFPDLVLDNQIEMNFDGTHIIAHDYGEHPIIYRDKNQQLNLRLMEWGCIPYYVKEADAFKKHRASMLNARSERILEDDTSYWHKIRNRRCLVPVNGFYEHRKVHTIKNKIPYFITLKEQPLFFLPGLYSVAELVDKETGEMIKKWTYAIITRDANSIMKQVHNDGANRWRMPLLLPFDLSKKWIEYDLDPGNYKEILNFEMPSVALHYIPVWSIRTPKLRPDDKAKNEFYAWENLPELEISANSTGA